MPPYLSLDSKREGERERKAKQTTEGRKEKREGEGGKKSEINETERECFLKHKHTHTRTHTPGTACRRAFIIYVCAFCPHLHSGKLYHKHFEIFEKNCKNKNSVHGKMSLEAIPCL